MSSSLEVKTICSDAYVPTLRYGTVNEGLYRGAYPTLRNFRFLQRLHIRSFVSLVPEAPTQDLLDFANLTSAEVISTSVPPNSVHECFAEPRLLIETIDTW